MVDLKTSVAPNTTLEAFWQPYWTRTHIEPVGSFFGNNDGAADGGKYSNYFSDFPDVYGCQNYAGLAQNNAFGACLPRSEDRHPTGIGEGGVALRTNVPALDDAEFGLYFENYDSRTPFVSFKTGSRNINPTFAGSPLSVFPDPALPFLGGFKGLYTKTYSDTVSSYDVYPKDIKLIGFSFNFTAPGGIAIQGEVSHRFDQPVQLSGADEALMINSPAVCYGAGAGVPTLVSACAQAHADPVIKALGGVRISTRVSTATFFVT